MRFLILLVLLAICYAEELDWNTLARPNPPQFIQQCHDERAVHPLASGNIYNDADQINSFIWLGNVCASRNESFLRENNIGLALSVADEWSIDGYWESGLFRINYMYVPGLRDSPYEKLGNVVGSVAFALKIINEQKKRDGNILIYCNMGISRSTTIVAAALLEEMCFDNFYGVLEMLRERRPSIGDGPNSVYKEALNVIMLRETDNYWNAEN